VWDILICHAANAVAAVHVSQRVDVGLIIDTHSRQLDSSNWWQQTDFCTPSTDELLLLLSQALLQTADETSLTDAVCAEHDSMKDHEEVEIEKAATMTMPRLLYVQQTLYRQIPWKLNVDCQALLKHKQWNDIKCSDTTASCILTVAKCHTI